MVGQLDTVFLNPQGHDHLLVHPFPGLNTLHLMETSGLAVGTQFCPWIPSGTSQHVEGTRSNSWYRTFRGLSPRPNCIKLSQGVSQSWLLFTPASHRHRVATSLLPRETSPSSEESLRSKTPGQRLTPLLSWLTCQAFAASLASWNRFRSSAARWWRSLLRSSSQVE